MVLQFARRPPASLIDPRSVSRFLFPVASERTMSSSPSKKLEVLVTRSDYLPSSIELLRQHFDVECWDNVNNGPLKKEKFLQLIKGKFGVYTSTSEPVDEDVIAAGVPSLRVVSTMSVGVDHVCLQALKDNNVRLGYTPGVLTEATAELTVALLLATSRRLMEAAANVKNGGWTSWSPQWLNGQGLHGSIVGIVGYGRIGHSIAVKLKGFSPKQILYTSRKEKPEGTEIGATLTDLDTLLKRSDFVIVSIALTPETKGIISRSKIALMKENAIFVNSGRGGLVDQDALVEALQQKRILAAGLDVMTPEPLPLDHPLMKLDNVVLLPHIGSASIKARGDMAQLAAENIIAVFKGTSMPAEYL
nr:PREDICTED: glyoxylate reductase/hydroxypyruvate reductase-like [Bemisia tabaci]